MNAPSSGSVIRLCLVGLPVGLIVIGVASLLLSHAGPPEAPGNVMAASGLRTVANPGTEASLRRHVETLAGTIGPRSHERFQALEAARFYLMSTLGPSNLGFPVREQTYPVRGQVYANVEAELRGNRWPDEVVVLGAHYDTVSTTPGADDNASGVAAMLALAEGFVGKPQGRTLRFVAFTNEEPPWFQTPDMGSYRYAASLKEQGVRVVAMLSLESLGYFVDAPGSQKYPAPLDRLYPDTGNFVALVGTPAHGNLVRFVYEAMGRAGTIPVQQGAFPPATPGVGWSDHWSFWEMGYPAMMLTDTAPFRNPHYHKASDTPDTLDYSRLATTVAAIRLSVEGLANTPQLPW